MGNSSSHQMVCTNCGANLNAVPEGAMFGFPLGKTADFYRPYQTYGVINVRALAAGALSGVASRHAIAAPSVDPIASGPDYAADVRRAEMLQVLVRDGHAETLVEAALRFPLGSEAVSTVLLGYSDQAQLEFAAAAMARGPLPPAALSRLGALWRSFAAGAAPS